MAHQYSFAMLKPGVIQRRLVGEIISRIEKKGLDIHAFKMMNISTEMAEAHYQEHKGKDFFPDLVEYITSGPVVAMIVGGDEAINVLRKLCGATKVEEALPGTIRGDYADHTRKNIIHASDSLASAARELQLYFRNEELVEWLDGNDQWI